MKTRRRTYTQDRRPPLYNTWMGMRRNCGIVHGATPYQQSLYEGISICPEWLVYANFEKWSFDNHWQKGLYLTRRDKHGDFSPDNCFFCSLEEANGYRNVVKRMPDGRSARDILGRGNLGKMGDTQKCSRIARRLFESKWSIEDSLSLPRQRRPHKGKIESLYNVWRHFRQFCSPTGKLASGCTRPRMSEEWSQSYESFANWCLTHGWKEGMFVVRKNKLGDFSPDNCIIVTRSESSILTKHFYSELQTKKENKK